MTWTTELPTEPGWYWVKIDDDAIIICKIYFGFSDKVLSIEGFDYNDELPLSALSFGVQFQPVKPPEG